MFPPSRIGQLVSEQLWPCHRTLRNARCTCRPETTPTSPSNPFHKLAECSRRHPPARTRDRIPQTKSCDQPEDSGQPTLAGRPVIISRSDRPRLAQWFRAAYPHGRTIAIGLPAKSPEKPAQTGRPLSNSRSPPAELLHQRACPSRHRIVAQTLCPL